MKITATSGSIYSTTPSTQTASATFTLSFLNPCIDQSYVKLVAPASFPSETYYIFAPDKVFSHPAFTFDTAVANYNPEAVTLCLGASGMLHTATVDSVAVTTSSSPVSYYHSGSTREFTVSIPEFISGVFNEDGLDSVGDTMIYKVVAELADWPVSTYSTATSAMQTSTIDCEEACDNPDLLDTVTDEFITTIFYDQDPYEYFYSSRIVEVDYCLITA